MIFFPFFSTLVFSMVVFSWCGFKEHPTDMIRKVEITSLFTLVVSFGVMMTDTAVKVAASLG